MLWTWPSPSFRHTIWWPGILAFSALLEIYSNNRVAVAAALCNRKLSRIYQPLQVCRTGWLPHIAVCQSFNERISKPLLTPSLDVDWARVNLPNHSICSTWELSLVISVHVSPLMDCAFHLLRMVNKVTRAFGPGISGICVCSSIVWMF